MCGVISSRFLFFARKLRSKLGFNSAAFSAFSVQAQKLNQHPAVTYDMGNKDFIIKRNKCCSGYFLCCFAVSSQTQYPRQTSVKNTASLWGALACLPHIIHCKS